MLLVWLFFVVFVFLFLGILTFLVFFIFFLIFVFLLLVVLRLVFVLILILILLILIWVLGLRILNLLKDTARFHSMSGRELTLSLTELLHSGLHFLNRFWSELDGF